VPRPTVDQPAAAQPEDLRLVDPLAAPDWDECLANFPEATFFHTVAWARVLNGSYGYRPFYITMNRGNRMTSALPLMEIDSWLTGKRGVSLPFTDECGPLGVYDDQNSFSQLFQSAKIHGKKRQWKYLECRGGRELLGKTPASTSYFAHRLSLQKDEKALFSGVDSSVRRAVRKAEQNKLVIEFSRSLDSMRTFYGLFCKTRQRHGVPPQPFSFFANIQRHVLEKNLGWVVLARHEGNPVAGAVFFHFGKSVLYKFGASDEKHQNLRANNLVMWEAIRRYAQEGFTSLDFGRTSKSNEGLRRFKLSWGAEERVIEYFRHDLRKNRFVQNPDNNGGGLHSAYKFMPILFSRVIGFLLYKHIAALTLMLDWGQISDFA
jgi:hypothetical protein